MPSTCISPFTTACPPEDQVTASWEKTAADSYRESLVAAQEAKEHDVEHEDKAINLCQHIQPTIRNLPLFVTRTIIRL